MKKRFSLAALIAALAWGRPSAQSVCAVYCYPAGARAVYRACVAYSAGIGQQVNNQNQLSSIQRQISDTLAQINAIDAMIANLNRQIAAQKALIKQTQDAIDELSRQIRFGEASMIRLQARVAIRDQLLNQRLRFVDSHGTVNYMQLVLTSSRINQLPNRP